MTSWQPLLLVQDFLGHRTHADLLEHFLQRDGEYHAEVKRFSVLGQSPMRRTLARGFGARLPGKAIRSTDMDFWSLRAFLVQGYLGTRAAKPSCGLPDVAYVHAHAAGLALRGFDRRVPTILSLDGTLIADMRMSGYTDTVFRRPALALERSIFKRADLIVSFSDWARSSLINDYGIPPEKTCTIPNAVMPMPTKLLQDAWSPPSDLPVIGFVGNEMSRKGGDLLLEAHQRYLADRSHLVLVTKSKVNRAGLRNVTIMSAVPRATLLSTILPKFAVYAHPARIDWSPYSVIEALEAGLPVVTTGVGSLPEMVQNGLNGYLLDQPSAYDLADCLASILENEVSAGNMARASRARFLERYNANLNYPELVSTLKALSHRSHLAENWSPTLGSAHSVLRPDAGGERSYSASERTFRQ